jgi:excisionase family DNA binding protein
MQTNEIMTDEKAKTKVEIAEYFGVTTRTIDGWMRDGILPYWKIGRSCRFDLPTILARLNAKNLRNGEHINSALN